MDFLKMMQLEPHGPDTWIGEGPRYPWGGLYGGQIVAQGLRAASHSVEPTFRVHSLHAYFIRSGQHDAPVRYEVDRIRDGRSFVTRRVVARQSTGAILNMSASLQNPENEPAQQGLVAPVVHGADSSQNASWTPFFERRPVQRIEPVPGDTGRTAWMRIQGELPNEPLLHACALAYMSDDLPTEAVIASHPDHLSDPTTPFWNASLDHAIWFHDDIVADRFHLHEARSPMLRGGRGLSIGHVYDAEGKHLATVNQEVLVRLVRKKNV